MKKVFIVLCALHLAISPCLGRALSVLNPMLGDMGSGVGSALLSSDRDASANWKMAGLQSVGGIPTTRTQCGTTISPSGITPPAAGDDAETINAAIAACATNGIVELAAGTFTMDQSETIKLGYQVTLRGNGTCGGSSSPYCATEIVVINGTLPYILGQACGTDTSHEVACSRLPQLQMGPATLTTQGWGWSTCGNNNVASSSCATPLDADAAQGATTVQVHSTTPFSVGMWVRIDEASAAGWQTDPDLAASRGQIWAASDAFNSSASPATGRIIWTKWNPAQSYGDFPASGTYPYTPNNGTCGYTENCDRPTGEIHLVTSIGTGPCPGTACTLTFDDPLTIAFRQSGSHNALVYFPATQAGASQPFLQYAGLENLTLFRASGMAVDMRFCAYCWIKNVEARGWGHGEIEIEGSVRDQIDTSYVWDAYDAEPNGNEYPIDFMAGATEIYLVNSITRLGGKGMTGRAGGAGSVVAYNYEDDQHYMVSSLGPEWIDVGLNGTHFSGAHHILF